MEQLDSTRLNRKILNVYWVIIGLSSVIELVNYTFTTLPFKQYALYDVVLPTILTSLIMLVCEWGRSYFPKRANDFVVVTGLLIAVVFICIRPDVAVLRASLFLPILVSGAYFNKRSIRLATVSSFLSYIMLYFLHPYLNANVGYTEHFMMLSMLPIAALAVTGVMVRGLEIADHYRRSLEKQEELIVENTLMEKLAKTDSLTGLYNQISFHQYLDELLKHHAQHGFSLQMAIFDLDNFKQVNDTYGHRAGDQVLKELSDLIKREITPDDFAARYGGEEFIVLFIGKPMERTMELVELIRTKIEQLSFSALDGSHVTVSIGVKDYHRSVEKEQFFEKADSLLYKAKRSGKNQVKTG
ncbi:GGDEF domain-containing protein [Alkalihalobacillus sp. AL-G]|uniref:GGDEF domain-containing protein n=1 Tax=Alkalihalobacillus sp. AL-G TaxID=2926399 RepID=UPI00272D9ED6|nr:GGDEF domain-containing protein [Alkalihalobacillus sp. AL-G]WLD93239.1 GGDEF domain-containing protein [Alkalihalobacillus sp. AL-G]